MRPDLMAMIATKKYDHIEFTVADHLFMVFQHISSEHLGLDRNVCILIRLRKTMCVGLSFFLENLASRCR